MVAGRWAVVWSVVMLGAMVTGTTCFPPTEFFEEGTGGCSVCSPGTTTATVNATGCEPCAAGTFHPSPFTGPCEPCPAHQFSFSGDVTCHNCSSGQAPNADQSDCDDCAPGFFAEREGLEACDPCPVGTFQSLAGQRTCDPCDPGSFSVAVGATECALCKPGTAQPNALSVGCDTCPAGSSSGSGAAECTECPPGTFAGSPKSETCALCPIGSTAAGFSATQCDPCAAGTSTFAAGGFECALCPAGTFAASAGSACTQCPIPTFSATPGATGCEPCPEGGTSAANASSCQSDVGFRERPAGVAGASTYLPCPVAEACCLGEVCGPCDDLGAPRAYTGLFCEVCAPGYYSPNRDGLCRECPDQSTYILIGVLVVVLVIALVLVRTAKSSKMYFTSLGIAFNFFQIVSVLASFDQLEWPPVVKSTLEGLSFAYLNIDLLPIACTQSGGMSYASMWLVKMMVPVVFVTAFLGIWVVVMLWGALLHIYGLLRSARKRDKGVVALGEDARVAPVPPGRAPHRAPPSLSSEISDDSGSVYSSVWYSSLGEEQEERADGVMREAPGLGDGAGATEGSEAGEEAVVVGLAKHRRDILALMLAANVKYRRACLNACLSMLSVVYVLLMVTTIEVWDCVDGQGVQTGMQVMRVAPEIECESDEWRTLRNRAWVALCVYGAGIPLLFVGVLVKQRKHLHRPETIAVCGLLYRRYRSSRFLWELVILGRKLAVVVAKFFNEEIELQVVVLTCTMFVALVLQSVFQPYMDVRTNGLEFMSVLFALVILLLGVALFAVADDEGTGDGSTLFHVLRFWVGVLVITLLVVFSITILVAVGMELVRLHTMRIFGVVGAYATDDVVVTNHFFDSDLRIESRQDYSTTSNGITHLVLALPPSGSPVMRALDDGLMQVDACVVDLVGPAVVTPRAVATSRQQMTSLSPDLAPIPAPITASSTAAPVMPVTHPLGRSPASMMIQHNSDDRLVHVSCLFTASGRYRISVSGGLPVTPRQGVCGVGRDRNQDGGDVWHPRRLLLTYELNVTDRADVDHGMMPFQELVDTTLLAGRGAVLLSPIQRYLRVGQVVSFRIKVTRCHHVAVRHVEGNTLTLLSRETEGDLDAGERQQKSSFFAVSPDLDPSMPTHDPTDGGTSRATRVFSGDVVPEVAGTYTLVAFLDPADAPVTHARAHHVSRSHVSRARARGGTMLAPLAASTPSMGASLADLDMDHFHPVTLITYDAVFPVRSVSERIKAIKARRSASTLREGQQGRRGDGARAGAAGGLFSGL